MKKFLIGCLGFSALCLAFSCGQQAGKQPANAAGAQAGSQWVHAVRVAQIPGDSGPGLLNLSHVTFIYKEGNVALVADMAGQGHHDLYKIDAADIPK
jgi:hypothetical protein